MRIYEICVEELLAGQKTDYDCIQISVNTEELKKKIRFEITEDREFSLNLKLPECGKNFETHVNGEMVVNLSRDGVVSFDKIWKCGDVLELILKMWD